MNKIDSGLLRCDGRLPQEARDFDFEFKIVENKGIVHWRQGCTMIKVTIAQNKESSQLVVNLSFSETSRNDPINERRVYEMKQKISDIFSSLLGPEDSQIEISIEVLCDDGSVFSAIVNAVSLACAHSGISLKDVCVSVTVNQSIDLCQHEESKPFSLCVVLCPNLDKILHTECVGRTHKLTFESAFSRAIEFCRDFHLQIRAICTDSCSGTLL